LDQNFANSMARAQFSCNRRCGFDLFPQVESQLRLSFVALKTPITLVAFQTAQLNSKTEQTLMSGPASRR
jgi:hypothetical protein